MPGIVVQFPVEKEGENLPTWSDRILTLPVREKDDDPHVIRISQKHHPEDLAHHEIIAYELYLWPHYHGEYMDRVVLSDGEAAKLVVAIRGIELKQHTKEPEVIPGKYTYWKVRFSDFATLKDAVIAIRGSEAHSPVALTGKLEDLEREIHIKTHSIIEDADEPLF